MIAMPHQPDASLFPHQLAQIQNSLDQNPDSWIIRACLEYGLEQPLTRVAQSIREATRLFRTAVEQGYRPNPWEVWDYFLTAIAIGDRTLAHLLSALPESRWAIFPNSVLAWLEAQNRIAFALFRGEEQRLPRLLANARAYTFEEPLPTCIEQDQPEIQNTGLLLESLAGKNSSTFLPLLEKRMELRTQSFLRQGRNAAAGLLDLSGLGLCRLAHDRGIQVAVDHVYLPLKLL
jgi:hypothetical protein